VAVETRLDTIEHQLTALTGLVGELRDGPAGAPTPSRKRSSAKAKSASPRRTGERTRAGTEKKAATS
jgi:hypothetical protein